MEKVEEDLARSKNLREKQAKEFSRQLEDLRIKHEKEVCWIFLVVKYLLLNCFQSLYIQERAQENPFLLSLLIVIFEGLICN